MTVAGVKGTPPFHSKGSPHPEKSIDRDRITKVSWSLCRCSAQRHSANRDENGMPALAGEEQEGQDQQNGQEEDGTFGM